MSIRDNTNQLPLFDAGAATPKERKRRPRQTVLARKCWNECRQSVDADDNPELHPATADTDDMRCPHCDGPMRLTAIRAEPDIVEALLKKAERLRHIIRAQGIRRRYDASRKGS